MKKPIGIRPFISFDLETTGVDVDKVHILELGAILDDGVSPVETMKCINILIKEPHYDYSEPYAMQMNAQILKEIMGTEETKYKIVPLGLGLQMFAELVEEAGNMAYRWDKANGSDEPSKRVSLAGKNVESFDLPILLNNMEKLSSRVNDGAMESIIKILDPKRPECRLQRRIIDVGSIYYTDFGYVPSLGEITKMVGWTDVPHRAIGDAEIVSRAIRLKTKAKLLENA